MERDTEREILSTLRFISGTLFFIFLLIGYIALCWTAIHREELKNVRKGTVLEFLDH